MEYPNVKCWKALEAERYIIRRNSMPPRPLLIVDTILLIERNPMAEVTHDYWYLENRETGHSKFYEIEIVPTASKFSVHTRHGRIGTKGRSLVAKDGIATDTTARNVAMAIAEGKIAKGYKVVRNQPQNGKIKMSDHHATQKKDAGRFGNIMLGDD